MVVEKINMRKSDTPFFHCYYFVLINLNYAEELANTKKDANKKREI